MSLSFRERFVLRLAAVEGTDANDSVKAAQEWAEVCCKAWGHDDALTDDGGLSELFTATCRRCGHVEKRHWDDDQ
ncbi:MAG TPA: hypothetical protein VFA98_06370 [Thermoanaerobaculia bacterium]|jgi:hypothetical protein|nr:hypothetical protein [Thermoanaerobaculia bacterium]